MYWYPPATINSAKAPGSDEANKEKEKGNVAFKNRDYAKAVEHYSIAITMDPNNHCKWSVSMYCFKGYLA